MGLRSVTDASLNESLLERLRAKRLAEDDLLVCMERGRILLGTKRKYGALSRTMRQAAILRDLCEGITPVIEPDDLVVGLMLETLPTAEDERLIREHPEAFAQPGMPGWLDSMSIYVPDWGRLLATGFGGIATQAQQHLATLKSCTGDSQRRREFLSAAVQAVEAVSVLIRRYGDEARRRASSERHGERQRELLEIGSRCEKINWDAPSSFLEALQLLQLAHMVLSCLVGGRDVTPGRVDQYLLPFYQRDVASGELSRDEAVTLLSMFFLRLSQMTGSGTDFDDNIRRSPCRYSHLYVTIGGCNPEGNCASNELSHVVADAVGLLKYKEPTLLVRYREDMDAGLKRTIAGLIRERCPVTVYNDPVVIRALVNCGVSIAHARNYAHSACHNVIVAGQEAGSGVGGFHNLPRLILDAMSDGPDTFDGFWQLLVRKVRHALRLSRESWERRWDREFSDACPLLQSCLMTECIVKQQPAWQAAEVSHLNHYLMGLGTAVDSLVAIRRLVFEERALGLREFASVLASDWEGHEPLRQRLRSRFPRYGQDEAEAREMASRVGRMWVEEVERASQGMARLQMWPAFYSHMAHAREGRETPATPDGRVTGDPLSENVGPSFGTSQCSPTSILRAMSALPFDHTPSGAATLTLGTSDVAGARGIEHVISLVEAYFRMGGLHVQINVLDAKTLEEAMDRPECYPGLMVRVTGFSAYFTRLSRNVQEDIIRRCQRDGPGA